MVSKILGMRVDLTSYADATWKILNLAKRDEGHYVCVANVHMLMEAYDFAEFRNLVNNADLSVPDGMPLVWILRLKGQQNQRRVYGPTLMLHILESAARDSISVGFYGSKPEVLESLIKRMQSRYDSLNVAYSFSPPFRAINFEEDTTIVQQIKQSGIQILFVGLGCPKQEIWMAEHRGKFNGVMIGVGAAFDFHAGVKPQAPVWMQKIGLEWLFRLFTEPRRLWKRYLYHNPRFMILAIIDLLRSVVKFGEQGER